MLGFTAVYFIQAQTAFSSVLKAVQKTMGRAKGMKWKMWLDWQAKYFLKI